MTSSIVPMGTQKSASGSKHPKRNIWRLALQNGVLWGLLVCSEMLARAQPPDVQAPVPEAVKTSIFRALAQLFEAMPRDEGWRQALPLVKGASSDARLAYAWRTWRRLILTSDDGSYGMRLSLREATVQNLANLNDGAQKGTGGHNGTLARVYVQFDIAIGELGKPLASWEVTPWQEELVFESLVNSWKLVAPPSATFMLSLAERGESRLQQTVFAIAHPGALLMSARYFDDRTALEALVSATKAYLAKTGKYPPARYFAALAQKQPTLRRSFDVTGSTRRWILNPYLAGTVPLADARPDLPLFFDGRAGVPYKRYAGRALVARANGQIELLTSLDDWTLRP